MYKAVVVDNDVHRGLRIWKNILPLVHLYTYQQVGPVSVLPIYRSILNSWQLEGGYRRDPFFPLDDQQEATLRPAEWIQTTCLMTFNSDLCRMAAPKKA
jgi:hypothetical protein